MRKMMLHVLLAAMCAGSAAAQEASPVVGSAKETAATASTEKKVCRREVVLGSNLTKRTCRTKSEWAALSRVHRDQLEQTGGLNRARQSNGVGRIE